MKLFDVSYKFENILSLIVAYLNEGNRNVNLIYINWENASDVNYVSAAGYVKRIGSHLGEFVDFMVILATHFCFKCMRREFGQFKWHTVDGVFGYFVHFFIFLAPISYVAIV